jgi:zinc transport system permease protein
MTALLFDPLFRLPFLGGLILAALLPLAGMYLRLRGEWLAALALAQVASAGALAAAALGLPLLPGGLGAAVAAALLKGRLARGGDSGYALLLLVGWSASILMVANLPLAEQIGHALFDGQLYFIGAGQFAATLVLAGLVLAALRWLSRPLLLLRFFPEFLRARGLPEHRYTLAFDALVALAIAGATTSIGVLASFGLAFVPAWIAYRRGGSWHSGLAWAAAIGVGCYVFAFVAALVLDQPFGPVCVLTLACASLPGFAFGGAHGRER